MSDFPDAHVHYTNPAFECSDGDTSESSDVVPRDRSKSDTSTYFLYGEDSPQLRNKGKRKFIKNIKPEAFKRPSSYSCVNADATPPLNDVVLVGYRKKNLEETSESPLQLGTLSPVQASSPSDFFSGSHLPNSVSMTSLLTRSCWSRSSVNSLPEFIDGSHSGIQYIQLTCVLIPMCPLVVILIITLMIITFLLSACCGHIYLNCLSVSCQLIAKTFFFLFTS